MLRNIKIIFALCVVLLPAGQAARALDAGDVLKAVAVGTAIRKFAPQLNDGINTLMLNKGMPVGTETRVVPMLSIGEKAYIGAVQFSGNANLVDKVEAALQYDAVFDSGKYRIRAIFPTEDTNLLNYKSVQGVGMTALIDYGITGDAGKLSSGGIDANDAIRAVAIGAAITQVADPLNGFINKIRGWDDANASYATKVVPQLSFGERAYIGGVQVAGPADAVARVKAVWQFEALLDNGKFRVKALVPTDSINPLKLARVKGVGVTALIDTTVATSIHDADDYTTAPATTGSTSSVARTGDAAQADDAINRAHNHIKACRDKVNAAKNKGHGKKAKGGAPPAHAAANNRLADAQKVLARARAARAQGDYAGAVNLANQAMAVADEAVNMMN